jgi:transcriptional regulator with XRE-family HTH domain
MTDQPGRPGAAGAAEPPDDSGVTAATPLQRLIKDRLRERNWSYAAVARRGGLPETAVRTLAAAANQVRPPRPATLDALARGLDVPLAVVRAAAAESAGLHYYDEAPSDPPRPGDQEDSFLIASADELSPEDRRQVAEMVESLRRQLPGPAEAD